MLLWDHKISFRIFMRRNIGEGGLENESIRSFLVLNGSEAAGKIDSYLNLYYLLLARKLAEIIHH
jgi:hypothetical protein